MMMTIEQISVISGSSRLFVLCTMSAFETFVEVTPEYAIDGTVSAEQLTFLATQYASILYLCPDTGNDKG